MTEPRSLTPTFDTIFFEGDAARRIKVPNYQRAFAWEKKQIDQFIGDLKKHVGSNGSGSYYFGHFIIEAGSDGWEIVDGQQRISTFVLFLIVCRHLSPVKDQRAFSLIGGFSTVGYDQGALGSIARNSEAFFESCRRMPTTEISDADLIASCGLPAEEFTRSRKRIALALRQIYFAFERKELEMNSISDYIRVVMQANCSHHLAGNKSVAVNVFEMHNTRGVPLTTIEIVKAMLMKFVYDNGSAEDREKLVGQIQTEFGEIYGMEEWLEESSFRGKLTLEQLLRLHLRVVADGSKQQADEFQSPAINANGDALVEYLGGRLRIHADKAAVEGVQYALKVTHEFKRSVELLCKFLPAWDAVDPLVGDVLILEREISCQFFLLMCRSWPYQERDAFERLPDGVLNLWERLLFTRDFHERYYNLKGQRDNFPALFEECRNRREAVGEVISRYLKDGFRGWDRTTNLQKIVFEYLTKNEGTVLTNAYYWWREKMIYVIYKFEVGLRTRIRRTMKGTVSVEHILPQEWEWIRDKDSALQDKSPEEWKVFTEKVSICINGLGNLLLLSPGENTSAGNAHPKDKIYAWMLADESREAHNAQRARWEDPTNWCDNIASRGKEIFDFMVKAFVGDIASDAGVSEEEASHQYGRNE